MKRDDLQAGYDGWQLIDCSINTGPVHGIGPVPVRHYTSLTTRPILIMTSVNSYQ